ncbi:MAG: lipoprotein [Gammaproteobacteria bacterium]|nr:lipoprotein [Gammaproteobacteria bacterium]
MLLLAAAVAVLVGCGNKGDLFLPSDTIAPEELEDASEKLKKRKPATPE